MEETHKNFNLPDEEEEKLRELMDIMWPTSWSYFNFSFIFNTMKLFIVIIK